MASDAYIIQKVIIDVETTSKEAAHDIKINSSDFIHAYVLAELEKQLSSFSGQLSDNEVLQIERLDLSMDFSSSDWKNESFRAELNSTFDKELAEIREQVNILVHEQNGGDEKSNVVPENEDTFFENKAAQILLKQSRVLSAWFGFLKTGSRPWWATSITEFNSLIAEENILKEVQNQREAFKTFWNASLKCKALRLRIIQQYGSDFVLDLLALHDQKDVEIDIKQFDFNTSLKELVKKNFSTLVLHESKQIESICVLYVLGFSANKERSHFDKLYQEMRKVVSTESASISVKTWLGFFQGFQAMLETHYQESFSVNFAELKKAIQDDTKQKIENDLSRKSGQVGGRSGELDSTKTDSKEVLGEKSSHEIADSDPSKKPRSTKDSETQKDASEEPDSKVEERTNRIKEEDLETTLPSKDKKAPRSDEKEIPTIEPTDPIIRRETGFTEINSDSNNFEAKIINQEAILDLFDEGTDMENLNNTSIVVDNAGLVILQPFLPSFFDKIGLLTPDKKVNNKSLAVHVLHYLATGEEAGFEHSMLFEKFLVGYNLSLPIERNITLSEAIKTEAEVLLNAVIGHWSKLKGSSIAALRETFLQRDGKLIQEEPNPRLIVERKTVDILMKDLDWSISIMKLPWLENLIFIEW